MLRHAFADDFVIHGAQLLPDARLNLAPKANLALALRDLPVPWRPGLPACLRSEPAARC